jgi:hypothetical protein
MQRLAPVPESLSARVREDASVVGVRVDDESVVGARIRIEEGNSPLGPTVTLMHGGPAGSRYVDRNPTEGQPVIALYEDVLLMAKSEEDLASAIGYVVTRVRSAELGAPGLHVRSAEGVIARRARTEIEGTLDEQLQAALAGARAERQRHESAPTLGDPEAFVRLVDRTLRGLAAYMPDVAAIEAWVGPTEHGLGLTVETDVAPSSPAGRALATLPEVPSQALGLLPASTSLGGVFAPSAAGEGLLPTITEVAGERLSADDQAALAGLAASVRDNASGVLLGGLGATDAGGYLVFATPRGAGPEPAALDAFLGTSYVRSLLGSLLGCPNESPRRDLRVAERTSICGGRGATPPIPALQHLRSDTRSVLAITQSASETADNPVPAALFAALSAEGPSPAGTLSQQPDVSRALTSAPPRVLSAWVILPGHLGRALGLFASPTVRALGGAMTLETPPAPILVFVERIPTGARLRLSLTPGALDQAAQAGTLATQIF